MLPVVQPCFPPPHTGFALTPARSPSSPSAPVTSIRYKAGFNPNQRPVGRGAGALSSELLSRARGCSDLRGSGVFALRLHSFPPKILIPTAHCLGYSQVHSALSCQEPVFFRIFPHTCLFAPILRNVNNFIACFYKMLVTNCHRAWEKGGIFPLRVFWLQ